MAGGGKTVAAELDFRVGRVVKSLAGRDKGRAFLVRGAAEEPGYVLVVDGVVRRMERPKRKKVKHLEAKPYVVEGIAAKWQAGAKVFDAEIGSALKALGFNQD